MRRTLLNLLTALSLLVCVAVAALWLRSYVVQDVLISSPGEPRSINLHSTCGAFVLIRHTNYVPPVVRYAREKVAVYASTPVMALITFHFGEDRAGGVPWMIVFPQWFVVVVSGALAVSRLRRRRRKRRGSHAVCPACGYDLRASPGRCPECGTARPGVSGA
jgi:hypothetical protein